MPNQIEELCGETDILKLKLLGGGVRRYHQEEFTTQNAAEHTWRVMVILLHCWPDTPARLVQAALYHDIAEIYVGDMPAQVKRTMPSVMIEGLEIEFMEYVGLQHECELPVVEYAMLKFADYAELVMHCSKFTGDRAFKIREKGLEYCEKYLSELHTYGFAPPLHVADRVYTSIKSGFDNVR